LTPQPPLSILFPYTTLFRSKIPTCNIVITLILCLFYTDGRKTNFRLNYLFICSVEVHPSTTVCTCTFCYLSYFSIFPSSKGIKIVIKLDGIIHRVMTMTTYITRLNHSRNLVVIFYLQTRIYHSCIGVR